MLALSSTASPTLASATPARHVTLYSRIREELRAHIAAGTWQPNTRMPSESALMAQYGVSRITVRQALGDLENERLIFRVAGKGSFVAQPKPFQELDRLQGFAEAMAPLGHQTFNKLIQLRTQPASPHVAEKLRLPPDAPVTELRRARYLDGQPVSLDITWVPQHIGDRLAQEDLATRDIFLILENDYGMPLGHADLAIDAMPVDGALASVLQVDVGAPVLRVERLTHDKHGTPLDYEHLFYRADNFQYRLRVHRG